MWRLNIIRLGEKETKERSRGMRFFTIGLGVALHTRLRKTILDDRFGVASQHDMERGEAGYTNEGGLLIVQVSTGPLRAAHTHSTYKLSQCLGVSNGQISNGPRAKMSCWEAYQFEKLP
jgi:hypothetical protein